MNTPGAIVLFLKDSRVPPRAAERIREKAQGREVIVTSDRAVAEAALDRVEIAAADFPPDLAVRAPALKWLQLWSAGADWLQRYPEAQDRPFVLTCTSGMHPSQMAEHFFGLLLSWCRKLSGAFAAQARGEWAPMTHSMMWSLKGKTMLIIGYGAIGRHYAEIARAFGMTVVGIKRSAGSGNEGAVRIAPLAAADKEIAAADVVVNVLPYTAETKDFYGERRFALMKESAVFANMGRGPSVDEAALDAALRAGRPGAALLDVTALEPLPPESPLWKAPNLLLTSHYAGMHPEYDETALGILLDNLDRFNAGKVLERLVDKKLGY